MLTIVISRDARGKLGFKASSRTNTVDKLQGGGAAERAGLRVGDVVTAVNGARLSRGLHQLRRTLPPGGSGAVVELTVARG